MEREGKEKEGDHDYMERDERGGGAAMSFSR